MLNPQTWSRESQAAAVALALLALAPFATQALDQPFILDLLSRLVIIAVAAVSLNLILGYGGMVSFGHAAFLGIGAYCVGIPAYYDDYAGLQHFGLAIGASALFALVTGLLALRTRGVHFIMITMAFSQMVFFAFVSIEEYGGDDGLLIYARSEFPGLLDLEDAVTFYYVCFVTLLLVLFLVHRIVKSRFGMVIQGARSNERRMQALGFPTFRYRLVCYVISGAICGFAGALLGNFTNFISPEMMNWTRSGELIFMVVLGGSGRLFGPVFGVIAFLLLEEYISVGMDAVYDGAGIYWHLPFGLILVLVVLYARGGIAGLLRRREVAGG